MGADQHFDWSAAAASALDWWRDAGVDVLVDDLPRNWLAVSAPPAAVPVGAPPAITPADQSALPDTLAAFLAWRSGGEVPEQSWSGVSIAASGPADASVMILTDCPDRDDDGALFSGGPSGRLFARMLAAIGLSRDTVHIAAVCLRRPTAGRMPGEVEAQLFDLARHHVRLVRPRRLLLLGNGAARAVLGADMLAARGRLHSFNHDAGEARVVATFHPRFLVEKPDCKGEAWRDLRIVMGDQAR